MSEAGQGVLVEAMALESVLRAYLFRYCRNVDDTEELLQETYARLLSSAPQDIKSAKAFCLAVARNAALDWLRHRQVVPIDLMADMESLEALDEQAQIEEITNTHQELRLLAAFIETLPARARQVFTLKKVYGYSQKEIALHLGISENTVEQHLSKVARRCAEEFAPLVQQTNSRMLALTHRKIKKAHQRVKSGR